MRAALAVATAAAWTLALPVAASAELVTFATGRTMSVKAARQDGASLVLTLRNGGEMVLDAALISSIGPDEVPYPDPIEPVVENVIQPAPSVEALVEDSRFDPMIRRLAAEKGVDATLVRAVIQVESAYQPRARSSRGAVGLMQVMPSTARQYGITNLYDPSSNIRAGVTHLKALLDRFPLALALAAYNAGEAAVARFAGVPPYPETIDYVSRIRSLVGR